MASWRMACSWSWPSVANGAAGERVGKGVNQVAGSALGVVNGGRFGHGAIVEKKTDGLGDAFGSRGRYVDTVAAIVPGGCADIPAVDTVTGLGAADGRGFMDKDSSARWCKGRAIEIIGAVEVGFGQKARVGAG